MISQSRGGRSAAGAALSGLALGLLACIAAAQTYDVLNVFNSAPAASPMSGLIQGTDGNLYGTTELGGDGGYGYGTIFKIDTNGSTLTTIHSFVFSDGASPAGSLVQATDGNLYGAATFGGAANAGTIFKVDTAGSTFTTLHSFAGSDGANPYGSLIEGTDGNLYGTTSAGGASGLGTIFKIDTSGATFVTLRNFAGSDGAHPRAGLVEGSDGSLYGTTAAGSGSTGTVFKIDTTGVAFITLHGFSGTDGSSPRASLVQGTDGKLYGTTHQGGSSGSGTVFKIDTAGTSFATLHTFAGSPNDGANPDAALMQATDGKLYGTTSGGGAAGWGTIFQIDTGGTTFATVHAFAGSPNDGTYPYAVLIQAADGNLYGTTAGGGVDRYGTIFRSDTSGTTFSIIFSFPASLGSNPRAGLVQATNGSLYGSTSSGGVNGSWGTLFRLDAGAPALETIHDFAGFPDGSNPAGSLIQATDGNLYGTTVSGGPSGQGTVFRIDVLGSTLTTLRNFTIDDGESPFGGLVQGTDGLLYGTTADGGASGNGTVFKIHTDGSGFATLHSFGFSDGANPFGTLIQGTDGGLYGTTSVGGAGGAGTVFKIDPSGAPFVTLHAFAGSPNDGAQPQSAVLQAADGNLYGTTYGGGASGNGTIFKVDTAGSTFVTLHAFAGSANEGRNPTADLIQGTDGYLYGTTQGGGPSDSGTIFKIDTGGASLSTLHNFTGSDGANPGARLLEAADGRFYGTASNGGLSLNGGVLFRLALSGGIFQVTAIAPTSGLSSGGTAVSIAGSGFDATDTVSIGGVAATAVSLIGAAQINATTPALSAGTLNDVVVTNIGQSSALLSKAFFADFLDEPHSDMFHDFVEKIFRHGITAGCGTGAYCPAAPVTRAQMAVFLLKGEHGATQSPPPCSGIFQDVSCPTGFAVDWIEQLYGEGITAGCSVSPLLYCPNDPVTRAQMAVFLLKAEHGPSYQPPACSGLFQDVACPGAFAVDWIEQLFHEGITAGCSTSPALYCPDAPNTRGQMAVFLTKTFNLP